MKGAPMKAVQESMGHATMEMTVRYAHLTPDVRRDAVRLLDQRPGVEQTAKRNVGVVGQPPEAAKLRQPDGNTRSGDAQLRGIQVIRGWRRRESNPGPAGFHGKRYVRSRPFSSRRGLRSTGFPSADPVDLTP